MAAELGIDKPVGKAKQVNSTLYINILYGSGTVHLLAEIEYKRTFLGCYFLSSRLRKASSMKYSDYVGKCSEVVSYMGGADNDYLIPYFIRLQQFAEDVYFTFDYKIVDFPYQDSARFEIFVKSFLQQLDQIYSSFPTNIWDHVQLITTYRTLRIYIHEVALHASPPSALEILSEQFNYRTWYYSPARSESLIACLEAAKDSLDNWLSMASKDMLSLIFPDYLSLVYAVLILARFSSGLDCPLLDCSQVRTSANLGFYLNALIHKTSEYAIATESDDIDNTCFYVMKSLWTKAKAWYDDIETGCSPGAISEAMQLDFLDILPSVSGTNINVKLSENHSSDHMNTLELTRSLPIPADTGLFSLYEFIDDNFTSLSNGVS